MVMVHAYKYAYIFVYVTGGWSDKGETNTMTITRLSTTLPAYYGGPEPCWVCTYGSEVSHTYNEVR